MAIKPKKVSIQDLGKLFGVKATAPAAAATQQVQYAAPRRFFYDTHAAQAFGHGQFMDYDYPRRLALAGYTPEEIQNYLQIVKNSNSPEGALEFYPEGTRPFSNNRFRLDAPAQAKEALPFIRDYVVQFTDPGSPTMQWSVEEAIEKGMPVDGGFLNRAKQRNQQLFQNAERSNSQRPLTGADKEAARRQALIQQRSHDQLNGVAEGEQDYSKLFTPKGWSTLRKYLLSVPAAGTAIYLSDVPEQKKGGRIHIKEKNKGKFTASAKAHGKGVQEYARDVLNDPNATSLQKRRANFARNAAKWNKG